MPASHLQCPAPAVATGLFGLEQNQRLAVPAHGCFHGVSDRCCSGRQWWFSRRALKLASSPAREVPALIEDFAAPVSAPAVGAAAGAPGGELAPCQVESAGMGGTGLRSKALPQPKWPLALAEFKILRFLDRLTFPAAWQASCLSHSLGSQTVQSRRAGRSRARGVTGSVAPAWPRDKEWGAESAAGRSSRPPPRVPSSVSSRPERPPDHRWPLSRAWWARNFWRRGVGRWAITRLRRCLARRVR